MAKRKTKRKVTRIGSPRKKNPCCKKKVTKRRKANPTKSAKTHLWIVFKYSRGKVTFLTMKSSGISAWVTSKNFGVMFKSKAHAMNVAKYWSDKFPHLLIGAADDRATAAGIKANVRGKV